MADWQIHLHADAEAKAGLASQPKHHRVCLVVAADASRRAKLAIAAERSGWQAIACGTPRQAAKVIRRARLQLTIVDLECTSIASETALRELTKHLAASREVLLVVCSVSGSAADEIWARQLGVWLYLPGLDIDNDLDAVCREAMQIATRHTVPTPDSAVQRGSTAKPLHEPRCNQRPARRGPVSD